jgi:serine O-acetyltransferase
MREGAVKVRQAWGEFMAAVRADHAALCAHDERYGPHGRRQGRPAGDFVSRIGFQMMVAYRVMRLCVALGVPLAPQIISRSMRHLYGADIHWDAVLEPGISLVHGMGICISGSARVGAGAILFQNVTLGTSIHPDTREIGAPVLGRDVHVGPGATLVGPIGIGTGSKITAGCLVTRSIPPGSLVQAGPPTVGPRVSDSSTRLSITGAQFGRH